MVLRSNNNVLVFVDVGDDDDDDTSWVRRRMQITYTRMGHILQTLVSSSQLAAATNMVRHMLGPRCFHTRHTIKATCSSSRCGVSTHP